jgi:hypothetical protein
MEKEDIVSAFTNANRNRYFKLFDYYEEWFTNKDYLSAELCRKIKDDLGIEVSQYSIHYIRSKIMPKRLADKAIKSALTNDIKSNNQPNLVEMKNNNSFEFNEPKSIDHNQTIVTFRKSKHETD